MSRFLLVLSFSLVMSACIVPVGSAQTTSPTASAPESTPTPQPTEAPTTTPTPPASETATPTPKAEDPNMPEGATGKDAKGNYIKTVTDENGKTTEYAWTSLKDAKGEVLFEGWTILKTPGGIPLIDWPPNDHPAYKKDDIGIVNLYVAATVPGNENLPSFFHTRKKDLAQFADSDLTARMRVALFNRTHNGKNPNATEMGDFDLQMQTGIPIDFYIDNPENVLIWNINPDHGTNVFLTDWDSLEGAPEFFLRGVLCRSKILGVDKDGNLIGVIAANVPLDTLIESQWWRIILFHAASVIDHPDQTIQEGNETLESWIAFADNKTPDTWIVQVPNK